MTSKFDFILQFATLGFKSAWFWVLSLQRDVDSSETTQRIMERIIGGLQIVPVQSSSIHLLNGCVLSMCWVEGSVFAVRASLTLTGPVSREREGLCAQISTGRAQVIWVGILIGPNTMPYLL